MADSHVNSYTRFKLALTEDRPVIKPYFEERWAELPDGKGGPIGLSLDILAGVHARLVSLLETLDEAAFNRSFFHPESKRDSTCSRTSGFMPGMGAITWRISIWPCKAKNTFAPAGLRIRMP